MYEYSEYRISKSRTTVCKYEVPYEWSTPECGVLCTRTATKYYGVVPLESVVLWKARVSGSDSKWCILPSCQATFRCQGKSATMISTHSSYTRRNARTKTIRITGPWFGGVDGQYDR
jgi:hypothetical protein